MGKIDDMRRQREAQHRASTAAAARATPARPAADAVDDAPGSAGAPVADADADASASADDGASLDPPALDLEATSGVCSVCGKVKPMQRGLIANHQKGLGKMCTGSRKPPA